MQHRGRQRERAEVAGLQPVQGRRRLPWCLPRCEHGLPHFFPRLVILPLAAVDGPEVVVAEGDAGVVVAADLAPDIRASRYWSSASSYCFLLGVDVPDACPRTAIGRRRRRRSCGGRSSVWRSSSAFSMSRHADHPFFNLTARPIEGARLVLDAQFPATWPSARSNCDRASSLRCRLL